MSTHRIMPYSPAEHDRLVEIWEKAVRATHHFLSEEDIVFYRQIVRDEALRAVEVWVEWNEQGLPVGFIGLADTKIEMLFVDPLYRGMGIGSRLIRHAEQLKGNGLQVDVNEQNEEAAIFYKRYGFVQIGRSELDESGKPFPILHLELRRGE
ncbi:acetyltransferase [Paenibacillus sp. NPDC058071]|uniref:acetyltransferase n=1 Tax=Paenibacillus sp. NPDC058071 TaxID=3346326 RepID=UPI0036DDF167